VSKRRKLPLDSPNWVPLERVHKELGDRLGDLHLAAHDLTEAQRQDQMRGMTRLRRPPYTRELLLPTYWEAHRVDYDGSGRSEVRINRPPSSQVSTVRDRAFYVWHADYKKIFGASAATIAAPLPTETPPRGKPGPKPTEDWHTHIARWLITEARDNPGALSNIDQLSVDGRKFLLKEIRWAPKELKDIRQVIYRLITPIST
jgi:hypothetical protein